MAGFNHYIYLTHFFYKGADAYPLIDEWIEKESDILLEQWRVSRADVTWRSGRISPLRLFPIGDAVRSGTPWWHHGSFEEKKKWYGNTGGFDSEIGWARYLGNKPKAQEKMTGWPLRPTCSLLEELPLQAQWRATYSDSRRHHQ